MSIRYDKRSTAARRIIALMGRRPRPKIRRPGFRPRYYWERVGNKGYQAWLEREKARIAQLPHITAGDCKERSVRYLDQVKHGQFFRLVDEHGRSLGKRYQRGFNDFRLAAVTRVRLVDRQEEDLHSQLSRMMKRAHRAAMKE